MDFWGHTEAIAPQEDLSGRGSAKRRASSSGRPNIAGGKETDYKQFRTATLWPMRRHGANGKRRVPPCGDLF